MSVVLLTMGGLALGPVARAQEGGAAAREESSGYTLVLSATTGEPILVEIEVTFRGEVRLDGVAIPANGTEIVRFVDVFEEIDDENRIYETTRTYLQEHEDANGRAKDSCLGGLVLRLREEAGSPSFEVMNGWVPVDRQHHLLGGVASAGAWIALPRSAEVGETFSVPTGSLLVALMQAEGELEVVASDLTLESVDEDRDLALLRGELRWRERLEELGLVGSEGTISIEVNLAERWIESVELQGRGTLLESARDLPVEVDATFTCSLRTRRGDAAKKALREKPKVRDVPRSVDRYGIGFELPSTWVDWESTDPQITIFRWTRSDVDDAITISVGQDALGDLSVNDLMKQTRDSIKSEGRDARVKKISSSVGPGIQVEMQLDDGQTTFAEFYHYSGSTWWKVQLVGPRDLPKDAVKDFDGVRKSLRRL